MASLPVVRVSDLCTGHDSAQPRRDVTGSINTFVNRLPVARVTDVWEPHGTDSHIGYGDMGSPTVFINRLPVMRIGDPITCGSKAMTGSLTVFSG